VITIAHSAATVYAAASIMNELVDALTARLAREVVGDGLASEVTMDPVHTAAARDRAEGLVDEAIGSAAQVLRPATIREPDAGAGGYIVSPAIVIDPPPDSAIVVSEQFAPVLPILSYQDTEDAIRQANATSFGLCASIWTNDPDRAALLAQRLGAGTVFLNAHGMAAMDHTAPFGGWKASGFGLELGEEGMTAFTRTRVLRGLAGTRPPSPLSSL
jgi:acyl-CoA reductase-like NAD-dependent aldehyde dehydrogenase